MRPSLFHSGLAPRLGAAVLYAAAAFGAVVLLAPTDPLSKTVSPAPATAPISAPTTVRIDTLRPVAAWDVRVDGQPAAAVRSDTLSWVGKLPIAPEATLVIEATPADSAPAGRNALRIRISGTTVSRDQTFWCERDWSIVTRQNQLASSPKPIDPEDLP